MSISRWWNTMKRFVLTLLTLVPIALSLLSASATDDRYQTLGGDVYLSGSSSSLNTDVSRDAFVSGFSSISNSTIAGDLHIAGFDVDVTGNVE